LPPLKQVLNQIKQELKENDRIREEEQGHMRLAISLSKQAILQIHQKKIRKSKKLIQEASEKIRKLQAASEKHPELVYGGFYSAALQEYSEANILLNLIEKSEFVAPKDIQVLPADYILGLADVIGEYRRLALDHLREGNVKKSEECLQMMDEIFMELLALDETYMLVNGLRRKNDVARKIIEVTRGDVTQEVRRSALEGYLKRFEKRNLKTK
jgi:translin